MMWHVVFAERGGLPQSRASRSRDAAIQSACELLSRAWDVWRVIEPNGAFIERAELDEHLAVAAESVAAVVAGVPGSALRDAVTCPAIAQVSWKDRVRRSDVALAITNGKGMGQRGHGESRGQHDGAGLGQHS
jgi:hypothetical protein